MKKHVAILLLAFMIACSPNIGYKISGKILSDYSGKVYLSKTVDYGFRIMDSADVTNGEFTFKGQVDFPDLYSINFQDSKQNHRFILVNGNVGMTFENPASLKEIESNGVEKDMKAFRQEMGDLKKRETELIKSIWHDTTATQPVKDSLYIILKDVRADEKDLANSFISGHPASPYRLEVFNIYIRNFLTVDQLDSVYQTFPADLKKCNQSVMLKKSIEGARKSAVGNPMIDFTMPGVNGEVMKLSDIVKKNKLVFIDFWASWCGPCRASIPELKQIYADYHDKGLEFFAVSYDEDREAWIKAIKEEGLEWPNASNLKGWSCPTVFDYAIRGIPASVLITEDGLIAGKNLRGEKLRKKIEDLLTE